MHGPKSAAERRHHRFRAKRAAASGTAACGHGVDSALGDERRDRASRNTSGDGDVVHVRQAEEDVASVLLAERLIAAAGLEALAGGLAHRGAKRRGRRVAGLLERAYDVSTQGARNSRPTLLATAPTVPADAPTTDRSASVEESSAAVEVSRAFSSAARTSARKPLDTLPTPRAPLPPPPAPGRARREFVAPRPASTPRQPRPASTPRWPRAAWTPRRPRRASTPRWPRAASTPRWPRPASTPGSPRRALRGAFVRDRYRRALARPSSANIQNLYRRKARNLTGRWGDSTTRRASAEPCGTPAASYPMCRTRPQGRCSVTGALLPSARRCTGRRRVLRP